MWKCPKCGRSVKRNGQSHYSGTAPRSIEEYISFQNKEIQPFLMSLTIVLRKAIGDYEEKILWSMPYIGKGDRFISFAANKDKVSLYVGEEAIAHFSSRLGRLKSRKSAISNTKSPGRGSYRGSGQVGS